MKKTFFAVKKTIKAVLVLNLIGQFSLQKVKFINYKVKKPDC